MTWGMVGYGRVRWGAAGAVRRGAVGHCGVWVGRSCTTYFHVKVVWPRAIYGRCRPKSGRTWAVLGPTRTNFGRSAPERRQHHADADGIGPAGDQLCGDFDRSWLALGQSWPGRAKFWPLVRLHMSWSPGPSGLAVSAVQRSTNSGRAQYRTNPVQDSPSASAAPEQYQYNTQTWTEPVQVGVKRPNASRCGAPWPPWPRIAMRVFCSGSFAPLCFWNSGDSPKPRNRGTIIISINVTLSNALPTTRLPPASLGTHAAVRR